MRPFTSLAVAFAFAALGVSEGMAQAGPPATAGVGSTLPLAALPYSGSANPPPCSNGNLTNPGATTFDGGGLGPSANSALLAPPGAYGMGTTAATPCGFVTSSGVISSPSSPASAMSPSTESSAAANSSMGAPVTGVAGLGTGALGAASLGVASTLPGATASPSSRAAGPAFCSEPSASGTPLGTDADPSIAGGAATSMSASSGGSSGAVSDPAQGVGGGVYSPAQSLAGGASLPGQPAPGGPCVDY
jgi:hypothetical protein